MICNRLELALNRNVNFIAFKHNWDENNIHLVVEPNNEPKRKRIKL